MSTKSETLTGSGRSPPFESPSADKTAKTHQKHPLISKIVSTPIYAIPLLVLNFFVYGATPFYYLVHFSPFHNAMSEAGSVALNQIVKWLLIILAQYITAVLVVSWSGKYKVHKNAVGFALMIAGFVMVSWLKVMVDNAGV